MDIDHQAFEAALKALYGPQEMPPVDTGWRLIDYRHRYFRRRYWKAAKKARIRKKWDRRFGLR